MMFTDDTKMFREIRSVEDKHISLVVIDVFGKKHICPICAND